LPRWAGANGTDGPIRRGTDGACRIARSLLSRNGAGRHAPPPNRRDEIEQHTAHIGVGGADEAQRGERLRALRGQIERLSAELAGSREQHGGGAQAPAADDVRERLREAVHAASDAVLALSAAVAGAADLLTALGGPDSGAMDLGATGSTDQHRWSTGDADVLLGGADDGAESDDAKIDRELERLRAEEVRLERWHQSIQTSGDPFGVAAEVDGQLHEIRQQRETLQRYLSRGTEAAAAVEADLGQTGQAP
jgi:hypothetical protein